MHFQDVPTSLTFISRVFEFYVYIQEQPGSFSKKLWLTKIVVIKQTPRRENTSRYTLTLPQIQKIHCNGVNDILGAYSSIQHAWPFVQTIKTVFKSILKSVNNPLLSLDLVMLLSYIFSTLTLVNFHVMTNEGGIFLLKMYTYKNLSMSPHPRRLD